MTLAVEAKHQSTLLTLYLIGETPSRRSQELYLEVLKASPELSKSEAKVIEYAFSHLWSLGFLDAGQALVRPNAELRRRIHGMFAILESMPEYSGKFLSQKRSGLYLLVIIMYGLRSVGMAVVGLPLLKALELGA